MSRYLEFTGASTEEAIGQAAEHFGLPIDRLEVEVVQAGSSGIFGLIGRSQAVVRARPRGASAAEEVAQVVSVLSGEEDQKPRPSNPAPKPAPTQRQPASPAGQATPAKASPPAKKARPKRSPASRGPEPDAGRMKDKAAPAPQAKQSPAVPPEKETASPPAGDALSSQEMPAKEIAPALLERAQEVLTRLALALEPGSRVHGEIKDQGVELQVESSDPGMLIGRRGQTLDALQYLTTRMVSQGAGFSVRVEVDAGGYRQRRRETLTQMAQSLANKCLAEKRAVTTGPLNAQDRRVVHLALQNHAGVTTASRGRGELKKVTITPA